MLEIGSSQHAEIAGLSKHTVMERGKYIFGW